MREKMKREGRENKERESILRKKEENECAGRFF